MGYSLEEVPRVVGILGQFGLLTTVQLMAILRSKAAECMHVVFVLQDSEVNAEGAVGDELAERFRTITGRLQSLKLETDEVCFQMHKEVPTSS